MLHSNLIANAPPATDRCIRPIQGDMAVCLPGQPQVRREILQVTGDPRTFTLRPDNSGAGVTLLMAEDHFHAAIAGPEQAEIEVHWLVQNPNGATMPLWALAQGRDVEASVWDGFGLLMVPDVLTRGPDAQDLVLAPGRYMLTAIVTGHASLLIGAGRPCMEALGLRTGRRNAG
jgi:hypothetical protein